MGSHFTSKVVPVVGVNDSLTLNRIFKNWIGDMEVFEYDDKKLTFLWLLFFFQLTLLMIISVCVCMYICKNPRQKGKGAKHLIHVYLGSFTVVTGVVLQNWFWSVEILGERWFFAYSWICNCELGAKKTPTCCCGVFYYYYLLFPKLPALVAIHLVDHKCGILLMEHEYPN